MLDHLVTYNRKKNNIQHNDAIENEPNFDNKFSLYSGTKPPTSSCCKTQGSKKQSETMVPILTRMWDSGAANSTI